MFRGFDRERQAYAERSAELLQDYEGQHVVILGDRLIGIRPTYDEALELGYDAVGLDPFYVKEILREDVPILVTWAVPWSCGP